MTAKKPGVTAYHVALERQGESGIVEIRARLRATAAQTVSREDARLLMEVADKLTHLATKAAEAERLRTLQYAVNSFIETVKSLVDDVEQSNG